MSEKDNKVDEFTMYAVGYKHPAEELAAEFNLFTAIKAFMETDQLPDGTYVKVLRANFKLAPEDEKKEKSKLILPDNQLVVN